MLTHPTLDQLRALKLDGMAQAFVELAAQEEVKGLAHAEWLALLLDREAVDRNTRRFQTRLRAARLRHSQASIEDIDYRAPRRLDKALPGGRRELAGDQDGATAIATLTSVRNSRAKRPSPSRCPCLRSLPAR